MEIPLLRNKETPSGKWKILWPLFVALLVVGVYAAHTAANEEFEVAVGKNRKDPIEGSKKDWVFGSVELNAKVKEVIEPLVNGGMIDVDEDKNVSEDELKAASAKPLADFDVNNDGILSVAEFCTKCVVGNPDENYERDFGKEWVLEYNKAPEDIKKGWETVDKAKAAKQKVNTQIENLPIKKSETEEEVGAAWAGRRRVPATSVGMDWLQWFCDGPSWFTECMCMIPMMGAAETLNYDVLWGNGIVAHGTVGSRIQFRISGGNGAQNVDHVPHWGWNNNHGDGISQGDMVYGLSATSEGYYAIDRFTPQGGKNGWWFMFNPPIDDPATHGFRDFGRGLNPPSLLMDSGLNSINDFFRQINLPATPMVGFLPRASNGWDDPTGAYNVGPHAIFNYLYYYPQIKAWAIANNGTKNPVIHFLLDKAIFLFNTITHKELSVVKTMWKYIPDTHKEGMVFWLSYDHNQKFRIYRSFPQSGWLPIQEYVDAVEEALGTLNPPWYTANGVPDTYSVQLLRPGPYV